MNFAFPPAFFITGTDTEVGKTFVSAVLAIGLKAHYWKPIGTGLYPHTDNQWVQEKTGLPDEHFFPEAYLFKDHVSPHLAAKQEGVNINIEKIQIPNERPWQQLIVEGAGGIMVPINDSQMVLDLIQHLNLPTIVVSRSTLGTINHTLLTVEKLREKDIDVLGIIMNGPKNPENRLAIEKYGRISVLAEFEPIAHIGAQNLKQLFE